MSKNWKNKASHTETGKRENSLVLSINDVKEKYFNGESLNTEEREALTRFDNFRIWYLNSARGELEFHKRYEELQTKAILSHYREFLKEKYDLPKQ